MYGKRSPKSSLEMAHGRKYVALSKDRTHYAVVIDLERPTCQPLHHVEVPKIYGTADYDVLTYFFSS